MKLDLDDTQLGKVVSAAVLGMISPENRTALLEAAIKEHLLQVDKSGARGYSNTQTRLQEAFNSAVYRVAEQVVKEELQREENLVKLRGLVTATVDKVMTESVDALATEMATAFRRALTKDRY